MEIEGKIILRLERQSGTSKAGNPWKKDEYVLETPGTYPKKVKFTIFGDKCDQMQCEVGRDYAISFDLDSREFNGRWYTDVNAYAVRPIDGGATTQQPAEQPGSFQTPGNFPAADPFQAPQGDNTDDLPF